MANVPRKHHYVPQVLLAGFTDDGKKTGTLRVLDLVRGKMYPSTPADTAAEKDYNLVEAEGVDPLAIESGLLAGEIEGPVGPVLERVRSNDVPTEDDRARLLAFMAMQALRGPSHRDAYDDFTTQVMRRMIAIVTETDERFEAEKRKYPELEGITREDALEWARNTKVAWPPTGHLQVQLPSFGTILDLLTQRSWLVMYAPDGVDFVCTDEPVVILPAGTRPVEAPRGFASADAPVLMPVGRQHALLGMWPAEGDDPAWHGMHVDARSVATMNTCMLVRATRFVVSATNNFAWLRGNGTVADQSVFLEEFRKERVVRSTGTL